MINVTTICLSCGRFDLLARSLASYRQAMPVETDLIILDDSMSKMGQAKALDKLVKMALDTEAPYIVFLEDDWIFIQDSAWYYESMRILESCPEVMLIGLCLTDTLKDFMLVGELSGVPIRWHNPWRLSEQHGYWNGWISSPRIMRRNDVLALPHFSDYAAEEVFDQQAWRPLYDRGKRSIWLDRQFVWHIGDGRSLFPTGDKLSPEIRTWQRSHK